MSQGRLAKMDASLQLLHLLESALKQFQDNLANVNVSTPSLVMQLWRRSRQQPYL